MIAARRRTLRAALAIPLAASRLARAQSTFVDATGRSVRIPRRVARVLPAGAPAAVLLVAVAPQAMIGWTRRARRAH